MTKSNTFYMIEQNTPFRGIVSVLKDGYVLYTSNMYGKDRCLTLEEYQSEKGREYDLVTADQLDKLIEDYENSMVTDPVEITERQWWDMLEVLPPCKWTTIQGVEIFHISERITGTLVSWYGAIDGKFFECVNHDHTPQEKIANKFGEAYRALA